MKLLGLIALLFPLSSASASPRFPGPTGDLSGLICTNGQRGRVDYFKVSFADDNAFVFEVQDRKFSVVSFQVLRRGNSFGIVDRQVHLNTNTGINTADVDGLIYYHSGNKTITISLMMDGWPVISTTNVACD